MNSPPFSGVVLSNFNCQLAILNLKNKHNQSVLKQAEAHGAFYHYMTAGEDLYALMFYMFFINRSDP